MTPHQLKAARLKTGLVQTQAAESLGVSQAYLNMLEKGKRPLTRELTHRMVKLYNFSPETLPVSEDFLPALTDNEHLAESLAKLEYPGFAYLRTRASKKNPAEVMLTALWQNKLEARVAEALPWLVTRYWQVKSNWLVEQAKKFNLQNRLGFVVSLALQVAETAPIHDARVQALRELRFSLDESRLAKEDVFYRPPKTDGERQWLSENRSEEARHWNLLTDLRPEHLQYVA